MLVKQQEGSLLARQKMFVQLRQDLERVSILRSRSINVTPRSPLLQSVRHNILALWLDHTCNS